jgi:hypothetical protein
MKQPGEISFGNVIVSVQIQGRNFVPGHVVISAVSCLSETLLSAALAVRHRSRSNSMY